MFHFPFTLEVKDTRSDDEDTSEESEEMHESEVRETKPETNGVLHRHNGKQNGAAGGLANGHASPS